jgi:lipopolysaccharide/colanic/teichoic acid biosynthesis glycosyltransferase
MEYEIIKPPRVLPNRVIYLTAKRILDISICLIILPWILPLMIACAVAIYLDSPGPIFFVQERMGRGGRLFKMYKFRTMKKDHDQRHCQAFMNAYVREEIKPYTDRTAMFKPIKRRDTFRVGRILRKLSLDELPQIINVLKGDMSIVGPRPNVLWEVEAYLPWHYERMEVLPGITGLAQVRGRSSINFACLVRNDIEYIENQSMSLDLKILWWTFLSTLTGKGAG